MIVGISLCIILGVLYGMVFHERFNIKFGYAPLFVSAILIIFFDRFL